MLSVGYWSHNTFGLGHASKPSLVLFCTCSAAPIKNRRAPHDSNVSVQYRRHMCFIMGGCAVLRSAISMWNIVIADGTDETVHVWGERGGLGGGGIIVPTRGMIPYDTVCGGSHSEIQKKQKPARPSRHQGVGREQLYSHSLTGWVGVSMRMPH